MSQYLAAQVGGYLPPFGNNEGQMMPAVMPMMRENPWLRAQEFDWVYIRRQWETLAPGKIFIESSPPNLLRVEQISKVFGHDSSAVISICDPYQHIASAMRRYSLTAADAAEKWVFKALETRRVHEAYPHFPFVSYEEFSKNPKILNNRLGVPVHEGVFVGKQGSDIDGISSGYCRSIGFFRELDVQSATRVLQTRTDIVEYFGYTLRGLEILASAHELNPDEFAIGFARRETWDPTKHGGRGGHHKPWG